LESLPTKVNSGGRTFGEEALREILGANSNYLVGFLQRVDNLKFLTNVVSTNLEQASQSVYLRLFPYDHVLSFPVLVAGGGGAENS
jgi:hypothetical protein